MRRNSFIHSLNLTEQLHARPSPIHLQPSRASRPRCRPTQSALTECIPIAFWNRGELLAIYLSTEKMASMPAATIHPQTHVGFDSITSQIERKLLKRGFQFNVICVGQFSCSRGSSSTSTLARAATDVSFAIDVGQTGLGKSTLINTIFASHLIESKGRLNPDEVIRSTTEIQSVSHIIEENNVRLRLNIVDTPGYGDLINNDRCWDPIVKYIKDQHSAYLRKELTAQRERYIQDTRIHCCLFFIQPSGHSLKPIDIVVLKKLSDVVNVVPVIAKADSLTLEERQAFKERIKEEFAFHNLKMYPYDNDELDEEERATNTQIKVCYPANPMHSQALTRDRT